MKFRTYLFALSHFLFAGVLLALLSGDLLAARQRTPRTRQNRTEEVQRVDPRKEKLKEEAGYANQDVVDVLVAILEKVNKNERPEAIDLDDAAAILEDTKRYASVWEEKQKSEFILLQSWVLFYEGRLQDAFNTAVRAAKQDDKNRDAWISQAVFAMLNGRRPLVPKVRPQRSESGERRERTRTRRPRGREAGGMEHVEPTPPMIDPSTLYGQKGVLDFDLSTMKNSVISERFGRIKLKTTDDSVFEYKPGEKVMLVAFMVQAKQSAMPQRIPPTEFEPAMGRRGSDPQGREEERGYQRRRGAMSRDPQTLELTTTQAEDEMMYQRLASTVNSDSVLAQQAKFCGGLYKVCAFNPMFQFLEINETTDGGGDKAQVMEQLGLGGIKSPVPAVSLEDSSSGAKEHFNFKVDGPFVMIVDQKGTALYAGPAEDFVVPFILTQLTEQELPMSAIEEVAHGSAVNDTLKSLNDARLKSLGLDPNSVSADPNAPVMDPNAISLSKKGPAPKVELSLVDSERAQKLLTAAELDFGKSRKRLGTYKACVENCRKILQTYPGSQYAIKAQEMLRKIPERFQKKYHLTSDEIGSY